MLSWTSEAMRQARGLALPLVAVPSIIQGGPWCWSLSLIFRKMEVGTGSIAWGCCENYAPAWPGPE